MQDEIEELRRKLHKDGRYFHVLMDISPSPIFVLSRAGKIISVNKQAVSMYSVCPKKIIGKDYVKKFLPPEAHKTYIDKIKKAFDGEDFTNYPVLQLPQNGERKTIFWSSIRLLDENNTPFAILSTGTEMNTEIQSKEMLAGYKLALDQSSLLSITDENGIITYVNDKFCKATKYKKKELLGCSHTKINSDYNDPIICEKSWKEINSRKIWQAAINSKAKDGSSFWFYTTIIPLIDPNTNKPYQYLWIGTDITKRKLAERQIKQDQLQLLYAEKMAALGTMAAGIAHEIGNPLAALRGRLEMLELISSKDILDKEDVLKVSLLGLKLIDKINKIIKGLKSYARNGSSDPFLSTSITALLKDLLELSKDNAVNLGIKVESKGLDRDLNIECREPEIAQLIVNLLCNSYDSIENQNEKWVKIELKDVKDEVHLLISDSGPGIPQKIREKIFDPFFTTKPPGKGTGLGLSISKTIVKAHQGSIKIDDTSKFTRFLVRLPKKHK